MYGGEEKYTGDLVRKREGNRPTGRRRRRWENNTKMGLTETG
jgi:hypothetical protein